jgi:hypothetical protein
VANKVSRTMSKYVEIRDLGVGEYVRVCGYHSGDFIGIFRRKTGLNYGEFLVLMRQSNSPLDKGDIVEVYGPLALMYAIAPNRRLCQ